LNVYPYQDPLNRDRNGNYDGDHDWDDEPITVGQAYRSVNLWFGLALFRIGKGWVWLLEAALLVVVIVGVAATAGSAPGVAAAIGIVGVIALSVIGLIVQYSLEDWVNDYNADRVDERRRRRAEVRDEKPRTRWG
jgi:hypothetical protein